MNFKQLDTYLLSKQGTTFDYPFDEKVRVYRIAEKMFALTSEESPVVLPHPSGRTREGNLQAKKSLH